MGHQGPESLRSSHTRTGQGGARMHLAQCQPAPWTQALRPSRPTKAWGPTSPASSEGLWLCHLLCGELGLSLPSVKWVGG